MRTVMDGLLVAHVVYKGTEYKSHKCGFVKSDLKSLDKAKKLAHEEVEEMIRQALLDEYWSSEDERLDREHKVLRDVGGRINYIQL